MYVYKKQTKNIFLKINKKIFKKNILQFVLYFNKIYFL